MEYIIVLLPLVSSIICGFFGKKIGDKNCLFLASTLVGISAILSLIIFYKVLTEDYFVNSNFDLVKKVFQKVDKTLGYSLSQLILEGPEDKLKLTQNTQPAIMTIGVSIYNVLNENFNFNLKNSKFFAGHSLGEYTALVCAGSLSIENAAYLLHERGKAMQDAVPLGEGMMTAV